MIRNFVVAVGVLAFVAFGTAPALSQPACPVPPCAEQPPTTLYPAVSAPPPRPHPVPVVASPPPGAEEGRDHNPFAPAGQFSGASWVAILAGMAVVLAMARTVLRERRERSEIRTTEVEAPPLEEPRTTRT